MPVEIRRNRTRASLTQLLDQTRQLVSRLAPRLPLRPVLRWSPAPALLSCLLSGQAVACSLIETPFETLFERADHVFAGQLSEDSHNTLVAAKIFKGTEFDAITIETPEFPTSCDVQLVPGEDYLFFETGEPPFRLTMGTGTRGWNFLPADWITSLEQLPVK